MKKKLFTLALSCIAFLSLQAQPQIDSTDMPIAGEILPRTEVLDLGLINYLNTDSNYIWDFSMINGTIEIADTFVSINSTPITYIAVFNNPLDTAHRATVASPQPALGATPGITIQNMINFYRRTGAYFGQVGFGAEINGIPVPVKYNKVETWYYFPIQFGSTDTSNSSYNINIPNLGYHSEDRYRVNEVDGWGVLYLPGDTFNVMRVKSVTQIYDSVYVDSLSFGIGFDRTETEYKWIAEGEHMPVFQVTERQGGMGGGGNSTDGWFVDHRDHTSIQEIAAENDMLIYPNPAVQTLSIQCNTSSPISWIIIDAEGRSVLQGNSQSHNFTVDVSGLQSGTYYFNGIADQQHFSKSILIIR